MEQIIPRGTKEVPINLGPPGKRTYHGILHIYKTKNPTTISKSKTIVALNIHTSIPVKTVVSYLFPYWHVIEHIRVIKAEKLNRYSTLIRFKTNRDAMLCFQTFDGYTIVDEGESTVLNLSFVHSLQITKSEKYIPPKNSVELPACPVCLEKLDETVNGLMTIQCDHTFHRECIYRWNDLNCPVCRLEQSPLNTGGQTCEKCECTDCLWICLVCGFIGCDRYQNRHAVQHYEETCHAFSKQIGGTKVWDYISDCYVHRIIINDGDDKLIEWENIPKSPDTFTSDRSIDLKMNHMEKEYLSLIAVQLENQKDHFQQKLDQQFIEHQKQLEEMEKKYQNEILTLKSSTIQNSIYHKNHQQLNNQIEHYEKTIEQYMKDLQLKNQKIEALEQQVNLKPTDTTSNKIKTQEKLINTLKTKLKDVLKQLEEEKLLNMSIGANQQHYDQTLAVLNQNEYQKNKELNQKIKELEEQVNDLTFHLDHMSKLQETSKQLNEDLTTASIEINSKRPKINVYKKSNRKI